VCFAVGQNSTHQVWLDLRASDLGPFDIFRVGGAEDVRSLGLTGNHNFRAKPTRLTRSGSRSSALKRERVGW
jgi:hypothetical protein